VITLKLAQAETLMMLLRRLNLQKKSFSLLSILFGSHRWSLKRNKEVLEFANLLFLRKKNLIWDFKCIIQFASFSKTILDEY
jgi:hypothetical protein